MQSISTNNYCHTINISPDGNTLVLNARKAFQEGRTKSIGFRKKQLRNLQRCLKENQTAFLYALYKDLRRPKMESLLIEVVALIEEVKNVLQHLDDWVKPVKPRKTLGDLLDSISIYNEPFGVVLVIGAWNYPMQLVFAPLIGALAAGNCVILKPSDISMATSQLIFDLLPNYLDPACYSVILGGVEETTKLLENKFDYIFCTGSTAVGKIVHSAAAKHLTPTTLELGGKSPVYIDDSADIEKSVRRIMWGKCSNSGQACVAPDYILCTREVQHKFVETAKKVLKEFYGDDIQKSQDLGRIITDYHLERLINFMPGLEVAIGGHYDRKDRYFEPTIVMNVDPNHPIMQEEIFGPILPIILVESLQDAIEFVNSREKPLALYIFSTRDKDVEEMLNRTSSGGVTINDVMLHVTVDCLPFGGVGSSGMGAYHGKATFDTFSHKKSILVKNFGLLSEKIFSARYPPYTKNKTKVVLAGVRNRNMKVGKAFSSFSFFVGSLTTIILYYLYNVLVISK